MHKNIELFYHKLINKIFPEFSNKVTWTLITFGIALIALPAPTYFLFINLIIDFYNKKTKSDITTLDINSITPSTGVALTLITLGLTYHILIKSIQTFPEIAKENKQKEIKDRERNSDIITYEKLIKILPPTSMSIELLKDHDFGNSFHENSTKDIEKLGYDWGKADQHFHNKMIEEKSIELFDQLIKYNSFLTQTCHYINTGPLMSMLTDWDRAMDMEWRPETEENVRKANKWGTDIYNLYCSFILLCKKNLSI